MDQIKLIVVPHYEGLSVTNSFRNVLDMYPGLDQYFPVYQDNYVPGRKFFWQVFGTLYHDDAKRYINMEREKRFAEEEQAKERVMLINPEILEELQNTQYYSRKKGRALFKMTAKQYPPLEKKKKMTYSAIKQAHSSADKNNQLAKSNKKMRAYVAGQSGEKKNQERRRIGGVLSGTKLPSAAGRINNMAGDARIDFHMSAEK